MCERAGTIQRDAPSRIRAPATYRPALRPCPIIPLVSIKMSTPTSAPILADPERRATLPHLVTAKTTAMRASNSTLNRSSGPIATVDGWCRIEQRPPAAATCRSPSPGLPGMTRTGTLLDYVTMVRCYIPALAKAADFSRSYLDEHNGVHCRCGLGHALDARGARVVDAGRFPPGKATLGCQATTTIGQGLDD